MKRYGDFIRSEEERHIIIAIRKYIDKEVMPVRMQIAYSAQLGHLIQANSAS